MAREEQFLVRYTNKDIMDKLEVIERKVDTSKRDSTIARNLALSALTLSVATIGWLISRL